MPEEDATDHAHWSGTTEQALHDPVDEQRPVLPLAILEVLIAVELVRQARRPAGLAIVCLLQRSIGTLYFSVAGGGSLSR